MGSAQVNRQTVHSSLIIMVEDTYPCTFGEEKCMDEAQLNELRAVKTLERDRVTYLIIHCTATKCNVDYTEDDLLQDHLKRKFVTVGYHYYVRKDGTVKQFRPLDKIGAHCKPYNSVSIGICYEGGLDENGNPANTLTYLQYQAIGALLVELQNKFPDAVVRGHRDMPLASKKACPCYNARKIFQHFLINDG